jgi:hypothetical protein
MNFQFYYEKLINSEQYKKFKKHNPKAYECSCFFILDKSEKNPENKIHFDFYNPKDKKIYSFKVNEDIQLSPIDNFDSRIPRKLSTNHSFELKDFEKLILNKMKKENITGKIQKIIFSMQPLEKKEYLVITVFLSNLKLLKVHIDLKTKKITYFEKKSFFDLIKIVKKK